MILIAIGSNLPSQIGSPRNTCEAALCELTKMKITVVRRSRWYLSSPVPLSDQPLYVNGAVVVETALDASELLLKLHCIEDKYGRQRGSIGAARTLDLDLLAYNRLVMETKIRIPHPRLHQRAFVLLPLIDIASEWHHPLLNLTAREMLNACSRDEIIKPLEDL